jgi:hypothetical protein
MLGHGPLPWPDFCDGAGVEGAGVGVVGVVVLVGVVAVLVVPGAAAAPAMPETAPAVARAPATMVAPSIFDIDMRSNLLGSIAVQEWSTRELRGLLGARKRLPRGAWGLRKSAVVGRPCARLRRVYARAA